MIIFARRESSASEPAQAGSTNLFKAITTQPPTRILCPRCGVGEFLPGRQETSRVACLACGAEVAIHQFPAIYRASKAGAGSEPGGELPEDGGRCFSHPEAPAVAVCDSCGRFMCGSCDTEWDGRHLCLTCIYDRREIKRESEFVGKRTIYDNVALGLLAIPVVFFYPFFFLAIFTGPMAMYYLVRYRKEPRGFVPRGSFRLMLAWVGSILCILGSLSLIGVILFAVFENLTTATPRPG